jgi:hypothetical protein
MAARFARPGQAFKDENNGLHANNGAIAKPVSIRGAIQSNRIPLQLWSWRPTYSRRARSMLI